jgi:tetratricopeptide (TPR) repeat protein
VSLKKALQCLHESDDLWRKSGYRRGEIITGKNIAFIYLEQGDIAAAEKVLENVLEVIKQVPDKEYERLIVKQLALMEIKRSDLKKALEYTNQASILAEISKKDYAKADNLALYGQISMIAGDHEKAECQLNDAIDIFGKTKQLYKVAETQYLLASLIKEFDPEKARSLLQSAVEFFKNAGAPKWVEECEKLIKS